MAITEIKALTSDQVDKLERFISRSADVTEFAKQALIWMLRQTQGMTKLVCLSFTPNMSSLGKQVAFGVHNMRSANGSTFLPRFLDELGAPMSFSSCGGHYTGEGDGLDPRTKGFTAWIAGEGLGMPVEWLTPDLDAIYAIKLPTS